jgi:uroporphyrinogen-III synthase
MRVLVTRPESEARQWVRQLRLRGIDAQPLPLIEIAPVADPSEVIAAWEALDRYRAAMFVSGNAVHHFFARRPEGRHWPDPTRAWAPGRGTREVLVTAGVAPELVDAPPPLAVQFDSETLWRQVAPQVRGGDRVLIVRGADADGASSGREWLAEQLRAAGAKVDVIASYRRQPPQLGESGLAQQTQGCVWLFSSSQAIAHLRALMPQADWSQSRAVATHPRIAEAARNAGFGVVCESRPSVEAVAAALESIR